MGNDWFRQRVGIGVSLMVAVAALLSVSLLLVSASLSAPAADGLWITRVTPLGGATTPFDRLEIQFSGAVLTGTFTMTDVVLSGPGGVITPTALNYLADDLYELVSSGTGLNTYSLVIGSDIRDLSDQPMDQNHNGIAGEPGDAYRGALFSAGITITDTQTTYEGQNLILYGNTAIINGAHTFASVEVLGGATLSHSPATTSTVYQLSLTITDTLWITAGAKIDVTGRGYLAGYTLGNTTVGAATGTSGGSYGGLGRDAGSGVANYAYGDYRNPNELGSGSGPGGGAGGGLARITAGTAVIDGSILANGAGGAGAGSGGGLLLHVGSLTGSGVIAANGAASSSTGGSGGGGRVAVYYDAASSFDLANNVRAHAGAGGVGAGSVGTVYLKQTGGEGVLRIDSHGATTGVWTPLGVAGDTVFVVDHLLISGTNVIAAPEHNLPLQANNVSILNNGMLSHRAATASQAYALQMEVTGTLLVSTTGKIDVSGRGYLAGYTLGNTTVGAATGTSGGSYGGLGRDAGSGVANYAYGDYRNPNELGSGSGPGGGAGGGLARITAGTAVIDGSILANGANGAGAGSGGGLLLHVGSLTGSGVIAANGGSSTFIGGSGGGGRVAVYYWGSITLPSANVSANGGTGGVGAGQPGSVHISNVPHFVWVRPGHALFHGTEQLEWAALAVNPDSATADVRAFNVGQAYPLAVRLAPSGSVYWDTTGVPDGRYELRATFYDLAGQPLGQATRNVLVNNSVVWHGGRLAADEVWAANRVHVVESPLSIGAGVTLTVQAGAVVKFAYGTSLAIEDNAVLHIPATVDAPVILTSLADDSAAGDTNLDGSQTRPVPGEWTGLGVQGAGQSNLSPYVTLRYARFVHAGPLASSETWMGTSVHEITGDVTVPGGATLTIQADAVVKFASGRSLIVASGGQLTAHGTAAQPIVFTSIHDDTAGGDTNHDGNATLPAPGDWYRIYVNDGAASFDYVQIRYGAGTDALTGALVRTSGAATLSMTNSALNAGLYTGILAGGGPVSLANSLIYDTDRGIRAAASTVNITNCVVSHNRTGLYIHGGGFDIANTIVSHNVEVGIGGNGPLAIRYSNVWNPGGVNYSGTPDQTGMNGNVSVDPQFKDATHGNYRLRYVSPMIDAADGLLAPATDIMGAPRYDDPRTPNTGITTTLGAFADMGAYEFVETAQSDLDLVVDSVIGPLQVTATQQVQVMWTVRNIGVQTVNGAWRDQVALLGPDGVALAAGAFVSSGNLGPNQTASFSATVNVPGGIEGDYRWQVHTNSQGDVFEGQNWDNNVGWSQATTRLHVPALEPGTPVNGSFAGVNSPTWYRVTQPADTGLLITLDATADTGRCRIYAGFERMPSVDVFDLRSLVWDTPDARLGIPTAADARSIYLLIVPEALPNETLDYAVSAQVATFGLDAIGLTTGGNAGQVTLPLFGAGFAADVSARLHPTAGGSDLVAVKLLWIDSTSVLATFDLQGVAPGPYDVSVSQAGATETLPGAFTVTAGVGGVLEARLVLPQALRRGMQFRGMIEYANVGDADLPAPLLVLESTQATPVWPANSPPSSDPSFQIIGVAPEGFSAGVLRPGERHTYPFAALAPSADGSAGYRLSSKAGDATEMVDWNALETAVRPDPAHPLWDEAWDAMVASIGATYGDYAAALAAAAEETQRYDVPTLVVPELLQYMLRREMVAIRQARLGGMLYLEDADHPLGAAPMILQDTSTEATFFTESWYDGSFGFRDVTPGVYALLLEGYLPSPAAIITVTAGTPQTDLAVIVRAGAVIQGRVVRGQSDVGVQGAVVSAYVPGDETQTAAFAVADADGAYALRGLEAGVYSVGVNAEGYVPPAQQLIVLRERQVRSLMLSLTAGGSIAGQVKLPDMSPANGALVYAENAQHRSPVITANAYGMFRIAGLPAGVYDVVADQTGYGAGVINTVVVSGTATTSGLAVVLSAGGAVVGTVTDAATGLPLGDVVVSTNAAGVYTLPVVSAVNGVYTFPDLPAGRHEFEFTAEGYLSQRVEVEVSVGASATRDIALRPAGIIAGQAQRNGQPLAGLTVNLVPVAGGLPLRVVTSSNGEFAFTGLEDGSYHVVAGAEPGLLVARQTYTLTEFGNTYAPTLNLDHTLLSGVVRTAAGAPVPDVTVTLFQAGAPIARATTDETGLYRFLVLESGLFDLWVESWEAGLVSHTDISITAGTDVQVDLTGGTEAVEVHVIAVSTGEPVTDTSVVLLPEHGVPEDGVFLAARTGESGVAQFPALPEGVYRLHVRAQGMTPYQAPLTVPVTSSVVVSLVPGQFVQGQLVDTDNAPLRGAASFFHQTSGQTFYAFSNEDGAYTAEILPEGNFDVWLSDGEHRPVFVEDLWLAGSITHTLGAVLAGEGATISGTVVTANGAPVDALSVGVVDHAGVPVLATLTDPDGSFSLGPLPPLTVTVKAWGMGWRAVQTDTLIPESGFVTLTLTLEQPVAVGLQPAPEAVALVTHLRGIAFIDEQLAQAVRTLHGGSAIQGFCTQQLGIEMPTRVNFPAFTGGEYSYMYTPPPTQWCSAYIKAFDQAEATHRLLKMAFDSWWSAYQALEKLSCADLKLALAQAGLVGAKAVKTAWTLNSAWGRRASPMGDPIINVETKIFDAEIKGLEELSKYEYQANYNLAEYEGDRVAYLAAQQLDDGFKNTPVAGTIYSVYTTGKSFYTLRNKVKKMVSEDVMGSLERYLASQALYHAAAQQHQRNLRKVQATANNHSDDSPDNTPKNPPKPPQLKPEDEQYRPVQRAVDPNDKTGVGVDTVGWVNADQTLLYTIRFENVVTATAPAQVVVITDTLDPHLDWSTLALQTIGFNDVTITIPAERQQFSTQTFVATDPNPVRVWAALDFDAGIVRWELHSVDLVTGGIPEDPLAGFLPPNDAEHRGEGYVMFTIRLQPGLDDGAVITNQARIVFDVNEPIDTNVVTNTLDLLPPVSQVEPLAPITTSPFTVTWSGSDNGAGVREYDIYVATDDGPFVLWQMAVTTTQASFEGEMGHRYAFYSVATDAVGHREADPTSPDAVTLVVEAIANLTAQNDSPTLLGQPTTLTATVTVWTDVNYAWDFADGTLGSGAVVTHTYPAVGIYTAVVTATNSSGYLSATTVVTIKPSQYHLYLPLVLRSNP